MEHIRQIQSVLAQRGMDAPLLTDPISCRYATGFLYHDGAALITRDNAWLLTDTRYFEAAGNAVKTAEVWQSSPGESMKDKLVALLKDIPGVVGAEETRMAHGDWAAWDGAFGRSLTPAADVLLGLRRSKDEDEKQNLIAAQRIAEKALNDVLEMLRPGLTEREVAAELTYRMMKYGGEGNSFDPIVVTGAKSSMPHGVPGDNVIRSGDFVTMDFGTIKNGYCSDMTRTVVVGKATDEMKEIYQVVLDAQLAGIAAAKAGVPGKDIDAAGRAVIEKAGYGKYFFNRVGHGVGIAVHENPYIIEGNDKPLKPGNVFSVEPGIYIAGKFGMRIENLVAVKPDGTAESLNKTTREIRIIR
jgi:Xaa-Pro aminopeptidase